MENLHRKIAADVAAGRSTAEGTTLRQQATIIGRWLPGISIKAFVAEVLRIEAIQGARASAIARVYFSATHGRDLHTRLDLRAAKFYYGLREIERRGLTTPAGWDDFGTQILDQVPGAWLIGGEGWYQYSRNFGSRYQSARYLCGFDDNGIFSVRVPASCDTVAAALDYHVPAAVKNAQASGRWVGRQGDVWLIELKRGADNMSDLPRGHQYDSRTLTHEGGHQALSVPAHVQAVRAYTNNQVSARAGD